MSDELFIEGTLYISAGDAASEANLTRDYVARLCREGKVPGRRIGKNWYVDTSALKKFLVQQEYEQALRKEELASERAAEYHAHRTISLGTTLAPQKRSPIENQFRALLAQKDALAIAGGSEQILRSPAGVSDAFLHVASIHPHVLTAATDFVHKLVALTLALTLTFGTYALVDPRTTHEFVAPVASALSSASRTIAHDVSRASAIARGESAMPQVSGAHIAASAASTGTWMRDTGRTLVSRLNAIVYAIAFPSTLTDSASSVIVRIAPVRRIAMQSNTSLSVVSTAPNTNVQRIVTSVIERTVSGITSDEVDARIARLDARVNARLSAVTAAQSTVAFPAQVAANGNGMGGSVGGGSVTYVLGASQNISHLEDPTIVNPVITGGSIAGMGLIGAQTLALSGAASVDSLSVAHDATIGGGLSVLGGFTAGSFAVSGTTTLASTTVSGGLAVSGGLLGDYATFTAATTTDLFSSSAILSTATSTSFFAAFSRFTQAVADSFTATFATISNASIAQSTTTAATTTNAFVSNLAVTNASTTDAFATNGTIVNALLTNAVVTNATSTHLFATYASTTNATSTNLFATNASTTNATATNQYANNLVASQGLFASTTVTATSSTNGLSAVFANILAGVFADLTASIARITTATIANLTSTTSTTTNATTTNGFTSNLVATNATATNSFATNFVSTNATTTNLSVGSINGGSLAISGTISSNLIPSANKAYDIGSPSYFWRNGFIDTLTVNNISAASTSIGGTVSNTFTLNSDNNSTDAENMSLIFFRGTVVPNAVISWDSIAKRFDLNQSTYIHNESGSTTMPTLALQGVVGQTGNLFQVASSSGDTLFAIDAQGNATLGNVNVASSTITNLNSTNSTTTNLVATNASLTSLTTTGATTTSLAITSVTNALHLGNAQGSVVPYTGTSCTNQFVRSLNGSGVATCATVQNSDLANSSITVNGTAISLGGSATISAASSTLLADSNRFTGTNTFTNTITGSITGNAGTVTNGVYTTTFNGLFDSRLAATTTLPNLVTLANLSTVGTITSGVWQANVIGSNYGGAGTVSGILKANGSGVVSQAIAGTDYITPANLAAAYPFALAGNATSTLTQFNGGLTAYASSTIGNGTQTGGLTISGGATTTGNAYFAGNVGVGTTNPSSLLHVYAPVNAGIMVDSTANTWTDYALSGTSRMRVGSIGGIATINNSLNSNYIAFQSGGTTQMVMNTSGSLGIGTTTPSARLAVQGDTLISGNLAAASLIATGTVKFNSLTNGLLAVNSSGNVYTAATSTWTFASSTLLADSNTFAGTNTFTGNTVFTNATSSNFSISSIASSLLKTNAQGSIVPAIAGVDYQAAGLSNWFMTTNVFGEASLAPTTTQNIAINGLGTSTFAGGLEVWRQIAAPYFRATSTTATSTFAGALNAGGSSGLNVLTSGRVGIALPVASIDPNAFLQVHGNIFNSSGNLVLNQNGSLTFRASPSSSNEASISRPAASSLGIFTGGSERMRFDSAGKVGLGTTTPTKTLAVQGDGYISGTSFFGGAITATSTLKFTNYTNGLLATDNSGNVYTTATSTWTFASSTLLADSNTFTGNTTLANATTTNLALTSVTNALHLGNAAGSVVAYTGTTCTNQFVRSINGAGVATCASVNLASDVTGLLPNANLANSSITINGTAISLGGSATISAASSTLLADSNTFSGGNIFTQPLTLSNTTGTTTLASGQGFTIGGSQFVVQQGSGNVGIGSATPSAALHIGRTAAGTPVNVLLSSNQTGASSFGQIQWYQNNTSGPGAAAAIEAIRNASQWKASSLVFSTSNDTLLLERMRITSSGFVGIGTTTPSTTLAVQGNQYTSGTAFFGGAITATSTLKFTNFVSGLLATDASGNVYTTATSTWTFASSTLLADANTFTGTNTFTSLLKMTNGLLATASSTVGDGTQTGGLTISGGATTTGNAYFGGNVGIGTSSPAAGVGLHLVSGTFPTARVEATANTGSEIPGLSIRSTGRDWRLEQNRSQGGSYNFSVTDCTSGCSQRFVINTTGLIGIGTTTPDAHIVIAGTGQSTAALNTSANLGASLVLSDTNTGGASGSGGSLIFGGTGSGGNLGRFAAIKGLLTNSALNSVGDLAFSVRNATGDVSLTERVRITSSGNVGIGTTTPADELAVQGDALISGNLAAAGLIATGTVKFNSLTNGLLAVNSSGSVYTAATSTWTFASSTLLADSNTFSGTNTFTSLLKMTNGLLATASSTIGNGTQTGGLTISGGATTTGNAYFAGNVTFAENSPEIISEVSGNLGYVVSSYINGAGLGGQNVFQRAGGTRASPTAVQSGMGLGSFSFRGWNGTGFTGSKAFILASATENWTTSANGTKFAFSVTPNGSTGLVTALTINQNGFIGIGTTTPADELAVQGDALISGNLAAAGLIATGTVKFNSLTNGLLAVNSSGSVYTAATSTWTFASSTLLADANRFTGANMFTQPLTLSSVTGTTTLASGQGFTIGASQFVVQQGSGNVGIGTSNPSNKLTVVGTTGLGGDTTVSGVVRSSGGYYQNGTVDLIVKTDSNNQSIRIESMGNLLFKTGSSWTERARIDTAGNFGIGTTSPSATLAVQGNQYTSGTAFFGGALTATSTLKFTNFVSGLLATDASGNVYTTATSTWTFASSTLLADANTFTGTNTFTNTITGSVSGNANTATTLQTARTINGVSFNGSSNITLTAASSTLLADSNTFTGNTTLASATTTNLALTSVTSALHLGNAQGSVVPYTGTSCTNQFVRSVNGSGVATCASVNLASDVTGTLSIASGGTNATSQTTNGVAYFDGTKITTGSGFIYSGGKVSIGSATLPFQFTVASTTSDPGTIAGFGNTSISGGLQIITNGNLEWGFNAANSRNLVFQTNQTERMRINASGNVGIGTTSPLTTLHVGPYGNSAMSGYATLLTSGTGFPLGLVGTAAAGTGMAFFEEGTTTRQAVLKGDVSGTGSGGKFAIFTANDAGTISQRFSIDQNGLVTLFNLGSGLVKSTSGALSAAVAGTDYITPANLAAAYPFALTGNATSTLTQFNGGLTAFASSTIGDGTQTGGLTISGGATTTGNAYFAGNVGVGTTNPYSILDVVGPNALLRVGNDTSNAGTIGIEFGHVATVNAQQKAGIFSSYRSDLGWGRSDLIFALDSAADTSNVASSTDAKVIIKNNGTVGIGTVSPTSLLHLSGTQSSTASVGSLLSVDATLNTTATANYLMNLTPTLASTSAATPFIVGLRVAPTLSSANVPSITNYYGVNSQPVIAASYPNTIANMYGYMATTPTNNAAANTITNFTGFSASAITNGDGVTSGTITNKAFSAPLTTASSSAGGIVTNYGFFGNIPAGSPNGGTTNNYGLFLTGNGGTSNGGTVQNYSLYNNSTANSYFAGNIGIGSTTPIAGLAISGPNTNSVDYTNGDSLEGALVLHDTNGGVGAGGQLMFSARFGIFAGIKGELRNGTGPAGNLNFQTRNTTGNVLTRMTLDFRGYLGIGTTSPSTTLAVQGDALISGNLAAAGLIATGTVKFNSLTNGLLAVNSSGSVYTTATSTWSFASSTLLADANRFTGANMFLASTTIGNGTQTGGLTISGGATTTGNAYVGGTLGIGTTTPSGLLEITNANNTGAVAQITTPGTQSLQQSVLNFVTKSDAGVLGTASNLGWTMYARGDAFTTAAQQNMLGFAYWNGSSYNSAFSILPTGNVGIGTTTPWARLSLDTSNLAAGVPSFSIGSSTRQDFVVTQAGNVGIGTANPLANLHVAKANGSVAAYVGDAVNGLINNTNGIAQTAWSDGNNYMDFKTFTNGYSYFRTGQGTESGAQRTWMSVQSSSGNVGLGTTTPQTKLAVSGDVSFAAGTDYTTTGTQNDVNLGTSSTIRYNGSGVATFTGIAGGQDGEILYLHNASNSTLTLSNQSASSVAANRIITGTSADLAISSNTSVVMQYDLAATKWRVIGGVGGSSGSGGQVGAGGPAFSVNKGGTNQTVTSGTDALLTWSTELFDTNNNFASNRFTPTVAGKYLITLNVWCVNNSSYCNPNIKKNGTLVASSENIGVAGQIVNTVAIVDMNGTTDYVESSVVMDGTTVHGAVGYTYFSGALLAPIQGSASFSGLIAATTTNSIDNTNFAQAWNWSSITTNNALSLTAAGLTTGSLFVATTSSASLNSTNGLLYLANTGASTNGILARMQSNSTADSGFTLLTNGNAGIGTTTPFAALQIATTTGKQLVLSDAGAGTNLKHWMLSSMGGSLYIGTTTDAYATSSPPALTILSNGDVGVSTTTPWADLSVMNENTGGPTFAVGSATNQTQLVVTSGGLVGIGTSSPFTTLAVSGNIFGSGTLKIVGNTSLANATSTNEFSGRMTALSAAFGSTASTTISTAGVLTTPSLTTTGSVGVGTTTPWGLLSVNANALTGGAPQFVVGSSTATHFIVALNGGVGLATTTPAARFAVEMGNLFANSLQISNQGSTTPAFVIGGVNRNGRVGVGTTTPWGQFSIDSTGIAEAPAFVVGSSTATSLLVANNGNVGIGTTSPTEALSVVGRIMTTGSSFTSNPMGPIFGKYDSTTGYIQAHAGGNFQIWKSDTTPIATFASTGNVGVGTTTPRSVLHVTGGNGVPALSGFMNTGSIFSSANGGPALNIGSYNSGVLATSYSFLSSAYENNAGVSLPIVFQPNGGKVGIGTTSPVSLLHVEGSGAEFGRFGRTDAAAAAWMALTRASTIRTYFGYESTTGGGILSGSLANSTVLRSEGALHLAANGGPATNGITISTTGGVGIGTTNPGVKLFATGSDADYTAKIQNTRGDATGNGLYVETRWNVASNYVARFATNTGGVTDVMAVKGDGNVGIGETSPSYPLQVRRDQAAYTTIAVDNQNASGATVGSQFLLVDGGNATSFFRRYRDGTGNTGIGYTGALLFRGAVGGTERTDMTIGSTGLLRLNNYGAGTLTTDASGNVTASSDERLKDVLGSYATSSIDAVLKINPILYRWNAMSGMDTASTYAGFSAQNIQQAIPEAVATDTRGYLTLSDRPIIATLVNAIRDIVSFAGAFKDRLVAWLGDATNGIGKLFAAEVHTKQLCVDDASGMSTCVTKAQLDALIAGVAAAASSTPAASSATLTPNGNNPAQWTMGTPWQDNLGALFTHGTYSETIYSTSTVDTMVAGTSTIEYWASYYQDPAVPSSLVTVHATRTVVVVDQNADTEAPVLTLNGMNPAAVTVGDTYTDAGATVTDNHDTGLTYVVSVDGGATSTPEQLILDTSAAATHVILFAATDAAGNMATTTRTVVVQ